MGKVFDNFELDSYTMCTREPPPLSKKPTPPYSKLPHLPNLKCKDIYLHLYQAKVSLGSLYPSFCKHTLE